VYDRRTLLLVYALLFVLIFVAAEVTYFAVRLFG
jgi:hypothetical protein